MAVVPVTRKHYYSLDAFETNHFYNNFNYWFALLERIFDESKWCDMEPCLEHEKCEEMADGNGWKCSDDTKTKEVVIRSDSEENKTEAEDKFETGVVPKTED